MQLYESRALEQLYVLILKNIMVIFRKKIVTTLNTAGNKKNRYSTSVEPVLARKINAQVSTITIEPLKCVLESLRGKQSQLIKRTRSLRSTERSRTKFQLIYA